MSDKGNAIWTPDGLVDLDVPAARERIELRPRLLEWFVQFNDFAAHFKVGLHCALCKKDLVAKNGPSDRVFVAACDCREFIGGNRDHQPEKVN